MSDKIDEEAILKFAGFEYVPERLGWLLPAEHCTLGHSFEDELVLSKSVYSLDWQAKYLWPKLIERGWWLNFANVRTDIWEVRLWKPKYLIIKQNSGLSTTILLAVQELSKEKA